MLFCTKNFRIKNKQLFIELTPVLIYKARSPIKHSTPFSMSKQTKKPIGYGSSESEDEFKLVDNK